MQVTVLLGGSFQAFAQTGLIPQWTVSTGSPDLGGNDGAQSVTVDAAGNSYITGAFSGTADFDPGPGSVLLTSAGREDVYLAKVDPAGALIYARSFGGGGTDQSLSIAMDASGNLVICGRFQFTVDMDPGPGTTWLTSAGGTSDIFIARFSAAGSLLMAKGCSGPEQDAAYGVTTDAANNIVVTGYFQNIVDFDPGAGVFNLTSVAYQDVFVARYSSSGTFINAWSFGGASDDSGSEVRVNNAGDVYVIGSVQGTVDFDPGAGSTTLTTASTDLFLARYSASGTLAFARVLGGSSFDLSDGLVLDAAGTPWISGGFSNTVDMDPGPGTVNLVSQGVRDIFLAHYDATGALLLARSMGGTGSENSQSLARDATGNLWISGQMRGTVDFDPGPASFPLTSLSTDYDAFVAKYDPTGALLFAGSMGSEGFDYAPSIAIDANGRAHVVGQGNGPFDADPGAGTAQLNAAGNDGFFVLLGPTGAYLTAGNFGGLASAGTTEVNDVTTDANGNTVISGYYKDRVDLDPGPGIAQPEVAAAWTPYVAKYGPLGELLFVRSFNGGGGGFSYRNTGGVATDAEGNVFVCGNFNGTFDFDPGPGVLAFTSIEPDGFLVKLDPLGNLVFAGPIAGTGIQYATGLETDALGNAYISGSMENTADFDLGPSTSNLTSVGSTDAFFAKYSPSGALVWAKRIGGPGSEWADGLGLTPAGDIWLAGGTAGSCDFDPGAGSNVQPTYGSVDIYLARYGMAGQFLFACTMGASGIDQVHDLAVDGLGRACISGLFGGTVDFDPSVGTTHNLVAPGGSNDPFLACYDASGAYVYAHVLGTTGVDGASRVAVAPDGTATVTANIGASMDADPGAGTTIVGPEVAFTTANILARYGPNGTFIDARAMTGIAYLYDPYVAIAPDGGPVLAMQINGNVDLEPGPGVDPVQGANGSGITSGFIVKYLTCSGDFDADGTLNCVDGCPSDGAKTAAGTCGCGEPEPGAACDDGNAATFVDQVDEACTCTGTAFSVRVDPRMLLEGPYVSGTGLMNDALRAAGLMPTEEPYTALGYTHTGGGGAEVAVPGTFNVTGNNAIVDWVVVELRNATTPTQVMASRSGLLQRDGDVVDVDGTSPLGFTIAAGSYKVAVRHRNHLAVMSSGNYALNATPVLVDLASSATGTYGTNARKTIGTALVLWAGDGTFNGQVRYTGSGNDRDPILVALGSTTPSNTITGQYRREDINLDGSVKYTGTANDRDPILLNVGSTTPNSTRSAQLP